MLGRYSPLVLALIVFFSTGIHGLMAQGSGVLSFPVSKHNFGDIREEEGKALHVFTFTNTGKGFLRVTDVKVTCGCTVSDWSKDSIAPGNNGFVSVGFDPTSRPGLFVKEVNVLSDGKPLIHKLEITGKVIPRPKGPKDYYPFEEGVLRFQTNHLTFGTIHKDESKTLSTIVYNQGTKPMRFLPAKSKVPSHLKPAISKLELAPGDTATIFVTYNGPLKDDYGFAFDNILLATTDAAHPLKKINISAILWERFPKSGPAAEKPPVAKFEKTEADMGKVNEGDFPEMDFRITNTGGTTLRLRKVSSGCTCVIPAVESTVIEPGETTVIRAKFNTRGRIGEQEKEVIVITNDPNNREITLRIVGNIHRPNPSGTE
jgi:hypothetical protein